MTSYDRRGFALAYVEALRPPLGASDSERDMPSGMGALFMLFRSTAVSCSEVRGSGFLEAGLLHEQLEEAGVHERVTADLERVSACGTQLRAAYLDVLESLLVAMLGDRADRVVSEAELHAIGVSTTRPDPFDYDWDL
ncbi:hypothetical protein [Allokutzneria sp. NRRL B-24872]|uniref:hypothetical protein n=1 Tax=Allokutzneria sp. NRRL B-24872 TaxID=1137961 RepID=UPI000A3B1D68|nr:hypothetical protein [Allokutzneria sp. NRRL B-24872]